jgi:hypothetical protein
MLADLAGEFFSMIETLAVADWACAAALAMMSDIRTASPEAFRAILSTRYASIFPGARAV